MIDRDIGAVLEMPGVRVVAIGAAQQAAREKQHEAQTGTVVTRRRFVGMAITERTDLVLDRVLIGRVGRNPDPELVTTSGLQCLHRRHGGPRSNLAVEGTADHVWLLLRRQPDEV